MNYYNYLIIIIIQMQQNIQGLEINQFFINDINPDVEEGHANNLQGNNNSTLSKKQKNIKYLQKVLTQVKKVLPKHKHKIVQYTFINQNLHYNKDCTKAICQFAKKQSEDSIDKFMSRVRKYGHPKDSSFMLRIPHYRKIKKLMKFFDDDCYQIFYRFALRLGLLKIAVNTNKKTLLTQGQLQGLLWLQDFSQQIFDLARDAKMSTIQQLARIQQDFNNKTDFKKFLDNVGNIKNYILNAKSFDPSGIDKQYLKFVASYLLTSTQFIKLQAMLGKNVVSSKGFKYQVPKISKPEISSLQPQISTAYKNSAEISIDLEIYFPWENQYYNESYNQHQFS